MPGSGHRHACSLIRPHCRFVRHAGDCLLLPRQRARQSIDFRLALSGQGEYASGYYVDHLCYAPYLHAFAAWDGKVYLCCMTNGRIEPLGDLSRQSLKQVFLGEAFRDIRRSMLKTRLASCHACDMVVSENRALDRVLGVAPLAATGARGPTRDGRRLPLVP